MQKNLNYALKKLENAFLKLKDGVEVANDELEKDGVIQRFEFTFEILWKTIKLFLKHQGVDVKTPRECLKEAFRIGIIDDEENFLDMLEDRNVTTHLYDKEESEQIFIRIKNNYILSFENVLDKLKKLVDD